MSIRHVADHSASVLIHVETKSCNIKYPRTGEDQPRLS